MKISLNRTLGFFLTLIISFVLLFILYGDILKNANTTFFSSSGDGLQHYYQAAYHAKHDSAYFRTNSMNYPYGEMIFFTGSQPIISNTVKFISDNIVDISDSVIGIQNVFSIVSILIGALILFLIFSELGIHSIFASLCAIAISFLSPQLDRFGGHYSLTYVFFIPLMLFLILKFHRKRNYLLSILIMLVSYIIATTHMYFLAFFYLLLLIYWIYIFVSEKETPFWQKAIHFTIQVIVPYLIFLITLNLNNDVIDRTTKPWGFLVYRAFPESVFLPFTLPYGKFLHSFMKFHYIPWEGIAYTGLIGAIMFFIFTIKIIKNLIKRKFIDALQITDNKMLNIFFWASLIGLLYSFGIPFVLGLEFLVDYIGPFKQMRGIARFAWVFYYCININAVYFIWNWFKTKESKIKYIIILLSIIWMGYDAYLNSHKKPNLYKSSFDLWADYNNESPDNQWVNNIDTSKYQAILPLPFYHIGSENYWIDGNCESLKFSSLASIKTGLPIISMSASRTSISQTLNLYSLVLEPYRDLKIIDDLPNNKDILVIKMNCQNLKNSEVQLLNHATYFKSTPIGDLYCLKIDAISSLIKNQYKHVAEIIDSLNASSHKQFTFETEDNIYFNSYDDNNTDEKYYGDGAKVLNTNTYNKIFADTIAINIQDTSFLVSFWMKDINKDLYPRTNLEIFVTNEKGDKLFYKNQNISTSLVTLDGDWGLIETEFILKQGEILKITLWNDLLKKNQNIIIDELLIKPSDLTLFNNSKEYYWINNRNYLVQQF